MLAYFFCLHPRMTQLNVIHEVGDSNDDSSCCDDDNATTDVPIEGGEENGNTESLFFSRHTLWYNKFTFLL